MRLAGFTDEAAVDIRKQIAAVKELGWSAVELRLVNGKNFHELHEEELYELRDLLKGEGVEICALGSTIANWGQSIHTPFEETKNVLQRTISSMRQLEIEFVRIMSFAVELDKQGKALEDQHEQERFRRLRYICDCFLDAGMIPVHENCHTYGGMSWEHSLRLIDKVPGLKLVYDTGNPPLTPDFRKKFPYTMQDSWDFYQQIKEHIVHIHIKDSIYDKVNGQEIYTYPGEGEGEVLRIVTDLISRGYDGTFSIEPHMAVVFHDDAVQSDDQIRYDNFISYGKSFELLLLEAIHKVDQSI
ncbi:MAG: sugar phosphate isomerase/epimerase [Bacteroidetes bacterium]|nr:sugar phosphate isomerase/epimerase [Bacteroidota bacterium]